jgi:putative FmdB family regulatory protein
MPFYEYQCKNCGRELEAMQKISEPPLKKCPHCGKSQLQRLMSAPVFRLKGGGWYETDFKDDKDKKRNLADKPDSEAKVESDTKAEAKVEAKGEAKGADSAPVETSKDKEKAGGKTADSTPAPKSVKKAPDKKVTRGRRKAVKPQARKARR